MRGKRERDKDIASADEETEKTEQLSEKELKKIEREASAQKRRKARQKDKAARFAGIILLGMVLLVGFLLWIAGEIRSGNETVHQETITPLNSSQELIRVR